MKLNQRQQEAVDHNEGPALVLAGAGTGKTRVITNRVIKLLKDGVSPFRILAVTFTRKAANEMNFRIANSDIDLPTFAHGRSLPWCGTFHALAVRFMSQYGDERFTVMDEDDAKDLLYRIFEDKLIKKKKTEVAEIIKVFSYSRNTGSDIYETAKESMLPYSEEDLCEWFDWYESRKEELRLKDFDDLLLHWKYYLEHAVEQGNDYFDYILVDEYQDTNRLQDDIIDVLSKMTRNIMVVGDDAQSIYGFRGSCVENILTFNKRYPDCKVIPLEDNYRSSQMILNLSNVLWDESEVGMKKELHAASQQIGRKPQLIYCRNDFDQSDKLIDSIISDYQRGVKYRDQAVLFRSAYQAIKLEMELRKMRIPYKKFGGRTIADAAHIKDLQAILRSVCSNLDEPGWVRFLKLLPGIGDKTAMRIFKKVRVESGENIFKKLTTKEHSAIETFEELFVEKDLFEFALKSEKTPEEVMTLAYEKYLPIMKKKYDKFDNRQKELEEFVAASKDYKDLHQFLNDYFLNEEDFDDKDKPVDYLTLSTIHSAKGCEWHKVMVISLADGSFPSNRSIESGELEEERRLMYVAFTRAENILELYFPKQSTIRKDEHWIQINNEESRFLTPAVFSNLDSREEKKKKDLYSYEDDYYTYDYDDF